MRYAVCAVLFLIGSSTCSDDNCGFTCSQVECVQGYDPFSCPAGTTYVDKVAICGCCPGCVRYKGPGESCKYITASGFDIKNYFTPRTHVTTGVPPVVESDACAPGLACRNGKCSQYLYECTSQSGSSTNSQWSPACDVDGSYKAVQCKDVGSDRRCFCYSKEGKRIFGFDWIAKRDKMQCLCSRLVADLAKDSANKDLTFHCSSNGNFEPLQCNRGTCYCADELTGQPKSFFVPDKLWYILPCYDNATMGDTYLRLCDSQSNALGLVLKETKSHGSSPMTLSAPPCDPDGSFYSKQCKDNQCFCRTRDNKDIGAYLTERNTAAERNQLCYCARDKVIFRDAGLEHPYQCDGGGNYEPLQTIGDKAFCVDSDGVVSSETVPVEEQCKLRQCSKNPC